MRLGPSVLAACLLLACGASLPAVRETSSDPRADWEAWRSQRREELAGPDGWLALVGLFWLEPGTHTIGAAADRELVLPSGPSHLGTVAYVDHAVRFTADDGTTTELVPDGEPFVLGTLRLLVIARGGRLALRVRDAASPARATLGALPAYDYDPTWRVTARVRTCDPPGRMLALVNVLGMSVDEACAAVLQAEVAGLTLALVATAAGDVPSDGYFVMLRDATSDAEETYPAGRYLDVPPADARGETVLDFNRLYTPPCGYTSLATCPLPPAENVVAVAIRAGERYVRP